MKLEALSLKNFKAFKDVVMKDIPEFCVIVGGNGTGKSTLFQVFGFLKDAMQTNVHTALNKLGGPKGFKEVRSRGQTGPIEIELKFRQAKDKPLITYSLSINEDAQGNPIVAREVLKYRKGQTGAPWSFLDFAYGTGKAVTNELDELTDVNQLAREEQTLKSPDILAIKGLAQFEKFPAVKALGNLIENWHVSDFHINKARPEQEANYAEHLSTEGDNLSLVTQYLHKQHPLQFKQILQILATCIPGITQVNSKTTEEGRVLLQFSDGAFEDPFLARYVSDGTIKMFAYLILLYDPNPHPLLCVEEPENQLYPTLLITLAEQFRDYARRGGQVFVSTHSPDFLNATTLDEVFWLVKKEGYTYITRAKEDEQVRAYMEAGDQMGYLWKEGLFGAVHPR
jgi:predicted ATPase